MADNTITIEFKPCEPTPAAGYLIRYRPIGGSSYRVRHVTSSPATWTDSLDPAGTSYQGFIYGDCGNGQLGVPIPWSAPFEGSHEASPSASASGSASASPEPPVGTGNISVNACVGEGTITEVRWQGLVVVHVSGDPFPLNPDQEATVDLPGSPGSGTLAVTGDFPVGMSVSVVDSLGNFFCQNGVGFGTLSFGGVVLLNTGFWTVTLDCGVCA